MSKKIVKIVMLLGMIFSLSACTKKPDAKEAAEAFVNTEFYLNDFDTYEKAFGEKIAKDSKNKVKKDLEKQLIENGVESAESQAVAEDMLKAIVDKTSFTAKTIKEEKDKATVELTVYGIDMNQFQVDIERNLEEKLLSLVNEAGLEDVKTLDDLMNLTSQADVDLAQKITDDFSNNTKEITAVIQKAIKEMKTVETESKVTMVLVENKDHKRYWSVKDESAFIDELTKSLML